MTKKIYFENLDGLRFLCFLSVFFFHSFHTDFNYISSSEAYTLIKRDLFGNGNLGVNFFFVLSGFLITYLLIEEKKSNGQINIKNFWIRRVLRIWPLYYFCVFFGFVLFPIIKSAFGEIPFETASIWYYLAFLNNFDLIKEGLPDASVLGVLWSVAIEEQFYFVWPIILYMLPLRKFWMAFTLIIIISILFRAYYDNPVYNEFHTLSCIGDMSIGAFGAWLVIVNSRFKNIFISINKVQIGFIYAFFIVIFLFRDELLQGNYMIRIIERPIIAIVILFIILEQNYSINSFFKLSKFKRISKLGVITYGLYCLQFIGILVATHLSEMMDWNTKLWQVIFVDTTVALAITIFISSISYQYYERPFLRLKEKFSYFTK